ncbi:MAG: hypothetical protein J6S14_22970 [Clostridia bacterium]|nr:hypothetical protein [Clostridia bacterium]
MTDQEVIKLLSTAHLGLPLKYQRACEIAKKAMQQKNEALAELKKADVYDSHIIKATHILEEI